jgi:hypothetical protein
MPTDKPLYIFLDESGNFDFSSSGTKYYTFTAFSSPRPCSGHCALAEIKYDGIETGIELEYFHATEDRQWIRNRVFEVIRHRLQSIRIDSLIIEKRKLHPSIYPPEKFYPRMMEYLLKYVFEGHNLGEHSKIVVITDTIPVKKKRDAVEKAIKTFIAQRLEAKIPYTVLHHPSKSNFDLQMVDYMNWAIFRKWETQDNRSHEIIQPAIKSEFDVFRTGTTFFY